MDDQITTLKPNSHKYKEEQEEKRKNIEKIVKGKVTTKKKSLGQRFAETFIKSDVEDVKSYILFDLIVPAIVDTFRDTINGAVDMFLYGGSGRGRNRSSTYSRNRTYTSYQRYYDEDPRNRRRESDAPRRRAAGKDFDTEIVLESRMEAEEVLDQLLSIIDEYGSVDVGDFYSLVGLDSDWTARKYGWTELGSAKVLRIREGYVISLPRPILLD